MSKEASSMERGHSVDKDKTKKRKKSKENKIKSVENPKLKETETTNDNIDTENIVEARKESKADTEGPKQVEGKKGKKKKLAKVSSENEQNGDKQTLSKIEEEDNDELGNSEAVNDGKKKKKKSKKRKRELSEKHESTEGDKDAPPDVEKETSRNGPDSKEGEQKAEEGAKKMTNGDENANADKAKAKESPKKRRRLERASQDLSNGSTANGGSDSGNSQPASVAPEQNENTEDVNSKDDAEKTAELDDNDPKDQELGAKNDPRLYRTLYVGNVSQEAKRKDIKKLFQKYGKVETVRIRGVIPVNPRLPKRAALLTNQLASFSDSFHAYVVFEHSDDVAQVIEAACNGLNMTEFKDRHLRVMGAGDKTKGPRRHSLFLGNLPFDCSEEDVIRTFQGIAAKLGVQVVNARVNRDADTGVGRGIGFVSFDDVLGVQGCLNAAGEIKIGGRVIRMEQASKMKKMNTKTYKKNRAKLKAKSAQLYWQGAGSTYMKGRSSNQSYGSRGGAGGTRGGFGRK